VGPLDLLTVGHGTLSADAFAALVGDAGVELVVDVRAFPGSRRHPHVAREQMARWLPKAGVQYRWEPRLGGRRRPDPDSVNVALRNDAFRGYADHMATTEFDEALDGVIADARDRTTVIMCSESVWWRCHRRLIADAAVLTRRLDVHHLMHDGRRSPHVVTDGARVEGDRVVYDAPPQPRLPTVW
jgi:uncharacterized protein (DUF488 family)